MNYLERAVTALSSFETNCQVYLLLTKRQDSQWDFLDSFSGDSNQSINGLVLRFTAEEVSVPETRSASRYYGNVWRQMVREAGYKLERGFQVQNLLQEVEKMDQEFSYSLLDQILKYAVRDKENGILRNKDFDFMERFAGKRAANTEQSRPAIQCLKEDLIGLEQVKEQVEETVQVMQFNQIRQKLGIETKGYHNVHLMLGAPGTAKTTVAQIMGRIMAEENLLPGSRFICVNGAELKGMYVGHSAPRTKALFEENDIIVIDEAYSLAGDGSEPDSFSREAIAQLVIELEEHAADKLVIFAGYGGTDVKEKNNKMKAFIDSNPGIKSRINSTFYFASYSPEEMAEIFKKHAGMNGYELPDGWKKVVENYFAERVQDDNFGNGREARSLFEKVSVQMAKRVMRIYGASGEKEARAIEKDDVRRCRLEDIRLAVERSREENTQIAGKEGVRRKIGF
jgi:SpoVK/Ycf46/Vps4 family AAA+-type ATPase